MLTYEMVLEINKKGGKKRKKKGGGRRVLSLSISLNHSLSWNDCFFVKRGDLKTVKVEALLVRQRGNSWGLMCFCEICLQIVSWALWFHGGNTQGLQIRLFIPPEISAGIGWHHHIFLMGRWQKWIDELLCLINQI